jgi:hypothetical protein
VFELPYTETYGAAPAYLLLAARAGEEAGYSAMVSYTGADYEAVKGCTTFAQRGVLGEAYIVATETIDDTRGILYTPSRDDPEFDSISRTALFGTLRFALIDDELIGFQTVTPEGLGYRLTGCIRGVLNTTIALHNNGATIWLCDLSDNVLTGVLASTFYVKLLPYFGEEQVDIAAVTAVTVTGTGKAAVPWAPSFVRVVKVAAANTVTIWPTTQQYAGAGTRDGAVQTDQDPPAFLGTFDYTINGGSTIYTGNLYTFVVTAAGGFTLGVRAVVNGIIGAWINTTVGAGDGTYYG